MKNCIFLLLLFTCLLQSAVGDAQFNPSTDREIASGINPEILNSEAHAKVYSDTSLPGPAETFDKIILKATKKNNLISLEWVSQPGISINKFEVERSGDGTHFIKIGERVIKNNKVDEHFVVLDEHPLQVNHYRLKMINDEEEFIYSKKLVVNRNGALHTAVQPNPFIQSFSVEAYLSASETIKVQLLDMSGRLLRYKSLPGVPGTNKIEFDDVGNLQRGIYMVRIVRGYSVTEKKIVKNN